MAEAAAKQQSTSAPRAAGRQRDVVRGVLDKVRAERRTSLTAPEGKLLCDAVTRKLLLEP